LPGDRVELQNNHLTINGQPQVYTRVDSKPELLENGLTVTATRLKEEGLARAHQIQILSDVSSKSTFQPIVVPDGEFLVMGDNRDNSADSRYIGFVRRDLLIGRAVGVMVSADIKGNWLPRLERFGKALN
jgi:signal peptidase I